MSTQRYEIEEWLGDDHGLTDEQVDELTRIADEIGKQYPDPDDQEERDAALAAAHRVMLGEGTVGLVEELAAERTAARSAELRALAGLRQAARMLIAAGEETQAGFARRSGVDRMAVRDWLGLRGRDTTPTRQLPNDEPDFDRDVLDALNAHDVDLDAVSLTPDGVYHWSIGGGTVHFGPGWDTETGQWDEGASPWWAAAVEYDDGDTQQLEGAATARELIASLAGR